MYCLSGKGLSHRNSDMANVLVGGCFGKVLSHVAVKDSDIANVLSGKEGRVQ